MEIELKELRHRFENTYSIIGNFVLRVDHATEEPICRTNAPSIPPTIVCTLE